MDMIIYLLLDCLDTLAIVFLMMSIFQYPIKEYSKEIVIICGLLSAVSYINREILHVIAIDPFVHMILLIVCLRYILKVKWYRSIVIATVGVLGFFAVQASVSLLCSRLVLLSPEVISQSNSAAVRLIQLASESIAYLVAAVIHKYDLGKTRFIRPPHDFYIRSKLNEEQIRIVSISVLSLMLISMTFYCLVFRYEVTAYTILAIVLYVIIMYLTYRREKKIGRHS